MTLSNSENVTDRARAAAGRLAAVRRVVACACSGNAMQSAAMAATRRAGQAMVMAEVPGAE